jgi:hypothetical protein
VAVDDSIPQIRRNPDANHAALEWSNYVVGQAMQASLGLVGPDVLGIAVEIRNDGVTFHVALFRHTAQADEDIEDMVFEFDALTAGVGEGGIPWDVAITVGDFGPNWDGNELRRIFLVHESVRVAAGSRPVNWSLDKRDQDHHNG